MQPLNEHHSFPLTPSHSKQGHDSLSCNHGGHWLPALATIIRLIQGVQQQQHGRLWPRLLSQVHHGGQQDPAGSSRMLYSTGHGGTQEGQVMVVLKRVRSWRYSGESGHGGTQEGQVMAVLRRVVAGIRVECTGWCAKCSQMRQLTFQTCRGAKARACCCPLPPALSLRPVAAGRSRAASPPAAGPSRAAWSCPEHAAGPP